MKVYTEVVYTWDDTRNELVEESSKSFDYDGEVTQCWGLSAPSWSPPKFTPPKLPKIKIGLPKKPKIVSKIQSGLASGATQMKKNIHSATTTARSNVHGVTTAGTTGLKEGASAVKAGVNTAYSEVKALGSKIGSDIGAKVTGQIAQLARATMGGQAGGSKQAMGSGTEVADTGGKYGSKALLGKSKRKKGDTKKDKLKVRVGGEQYA